MSMLDKFRRKKVERTKEPSPQKIEGKKEEKAVIKNNVPEPWSIGYKIENRYEIKGIKEGGMGIVYIIRVIDPEARLSDFARPGSVTVTHTTDIIESLKTANMTWHELGIDTIAIKTIKDEFLGYLNLRQFLEEAEIWIRLGSHRNIVKAFPYFVQNKTLDGILLEKETKDYDKPYIVLEFVDGVDLHTYIRGEDISISRCLDIAIQFCNGMVFAYNQSGGGIVHGDIKPSNILIDSKGTVKITDWGLAQGLAYELPQTAITPHGYEPPTLITPRDKEYFGGTPEYMSPEQFQGMRKCDVRSDVYSFGIILYEMLTGVLPFKAEWSTQEERWQEYKAKHDQEKVLPPSQKTKIIPKTLDRIVMKCIEKKNEDRYSNFADLMMELIAEFHRLTGKIPHLESEDFFELGQSYYRGGRAEVSLSFYQKALELDPHNTDALFNLGTAYFDLNRREEAMPFYRRFLELEPYSNDAAYLREAFPELRGA